MSVVREFDQDGTLVSETPAPDPEPTPEDRLAAIEARTGSPSDDQALHDAIAAATTVTALKDALLGKGGKPRVPGKPAT